MIEKIKLFKKITGEYHFEYIAKNRAVIASSELFSRKAEAIHAIDRMKECLTHQPRFRIFCGSNDKYYFELESEDGATIYSSQGYSSVNAVTDATTLLKQIAMKAKLVEIK